MKEIYFSFEINKICSYPITDDDFFQNCLLLYIHGLEIEIIPANYATRTLIQAYY